MFITFEGIDLSGKSTQIRLLEDMLKKENEKVISVREPGGTEVSESIREILLHKKDLKMEYVTEFLLFSSSRYQLTREVIIPHLKKNYFVISDRYFDSSTAYQGYGGMIDMQTVQSVNKIASLNTIPDITFLINISIDELIKRKSLMKKNEDRIEQKEISYYEKVIDGYLQIAATNKDRFVVIDGSDTIGSVSNQIASVIQSKRKN